MTRVHLLIPLTFVLSPGAAEVSADAGESAFDCVRGFVGNEGQWASEGLFVGRAGSIVLRAARGRVDLHLPANDGGVVARYSFDGPGSAVAPIASDPLEGAYRFFVGRDPARWVRHARSWRTLTYPEVAPGVSVRFRWSEGGLAYDVLVDEGADSSSLVVRVDGIESLDVDDQGRLVMNTSLGTLRHSAPVTWRKDAHGARVPVTAEFAALDGCRFGFRSPARGPLVIDPDLEWSSWLSGTVLAPAISGWGTRAQTAAVRSSDAVVVGGFTQHLDFPTTTGAYQSTHGGNETDAFVTEFDPTGGQLNYSTLIGGPLHADHIRELKLTSNGDIVVAGLASPGFPVTPGAYDTTFAGTDGFVARLDATGSALLYATFVGGSSFETTYGLALTEFDEPVVTGATRSVDFPVSSSAYDATFHGGFDNDAFVAKFDVTGGQLLAGTYLGREVDDFGSSVALGPLGRIFVTGSTASQGFPTTPGVVKTSGLSQDAFVTVFEPALDSLVYSTRLGGDAGSELAWGGIHVDASGVATLAGQTKSSDFATTPGAFQETCTPQCIEKFVTRLTPAGDAYNWSTYLGGLKTDRIHRLVVDPSGAATVVGGTNPPGIPTTKGAFQESSSTTPTEVFVTRFHPDGSSLLYSTLFGGSQTEGTTLTLGLALGPEGGAVITGTSNSADLPITPGAYDTTFELTGNSFIAKLSMLPKGAERYGASTAGCGGAVTIAVNSQPCVSNPDFGLVGTGAAPGALGFLVTGTSPLDPPLVIGATSVYVNVGSAIFIPVQADATGSIETSTSLAAAGLTPGLAAYTQWLWIDGCGPIGWATSAGLEIVIQP